MKCVLKNIFNSVKYYQWTLVYYKVFLDHFLVSCAPSKKSKTEKHSVCISQIKSYVENNKNLKY